MSDEVLPGVVFDCMIYLQAAASPTGPAAAALRLLDSETITLNSSEGTNLRAIVPGLKITDPAALLRDLSTTRRT